VNIKHLTHQFHRNIPSVRPDKDQEWDKKKGKQGKLDKKEKEQSLDDYRNGRDKYREGNDGERVSICEEVYTFYFIVMFYYSEKFSLVEIKFCIIIQTKCDV
jgi:hypothetical protein